jgi:hypothetical protein
MPRLSFPGRQSRAEKAANQQAKSHPRRRPLPPFTARVAITEIVVPPNGASRETTAPEPERSPPSRRSFDAQRFAWIDQVILDHNMPVLARLVAVRIGMEYLNPTSGDAWPSQVTLAAELGVTVRAIQKSLDVLVGAGHLHREVPLGRGHNNHYRPILRTENTNAGSPISDIKDEQGFAIKSPKTRTAKPENTNGCEIKGEPPFVQSLLSKNPLKKNSLKEEDISAATDSDLAASSNSGSNSDFDVWWQHYPKRVGKLQAEKAYRAALKSGRATAAELLAGAGRCADERAGQDPKFTKHPAKWLNSGGWMDEPQASTGLAKKGSVYAGLASFVNGGSRGK